MAFELSGATFPLDVQLASTGNIPIDNAKGCFLVALSVERIEFKPYKLKFLSGLAVAIFVAAAFDLESEEDDEEREIRRAVERQGETQTDTERIDQSVLDLRDETQYQIEVRRREAAAAVMAETKRPFAETQRETQTEEIQQQTVTETETRTETDGDQQRGIQTAVWRETETGSGLRW